MERFQIWGHVPLQKVSCMRSYPKLKMQSICSLFICKLLSPGLEKSNIETFLTKKVQDLKEDSPLSPGLTKSHAILSSGL